MLIMGKNKGKETVLNGTKFGCGTRLIDVPFNTKIYYVFGEGELGSELYYGFVHGIERSGVTILRLVDRDLRYIHRDVSHYFVDLEKAKTYALEKYQAKIARIV